MFVIALSGKQRSGKSELAAALSRNLVIPVVACADSIKEEFLAKHPEVSSTQLEDQKHLYRQELIDIGSEKRIFRSEYWIERVLVEAAHKDRHRIVIVPDMRLRAEYEYVKTCFPNLTVRLSVPHEILQVRAGGNLTCEDDPTECELDDHLIPWDLRLDNSDRSRFYENIKTVEERLKFILLKRMNQAQLA